MNFQYSLNQLSDKISKISSIKVKERTLNNEYLIEKEIHAITNTNFEAPGISSMYIYKNDGESNTNVDYDSNS